ncbi:MAG: ATP-binding cassette domain-containing protein [Proteobacteria bacterium]|nr:ATP-binding cassette domain-containing protein [Pseudomonadota bacterium]
MNETSPIDARPAAREPLIELRHVSKSWPTPDGASRVTILDDVDLDVRDGEMLALLGQSGCGKSTILRLMAGLAEPTQGAVLRGGEPLAGVNPDLAIVFQSFALYPWLTVEENVRVGLIQRRLDAAAEAREIERALTVIGLTGYENAYPKQLSGGMRQRVGFARALVARPRILCMDEAFSALDVLTAENLRNEVVELWRNSEDAGIRSIFFVTHNIDEAVFMASRIVIISSHPGRIRHVIDNPLPYPRDVNAPGYAALVAQIRAAITSLALPDEPAAARAERVVLPLDSAALEPGSASDAVVPTTRATRTRVESIPAVPVNTIVGLLEILEDSRETIDVFELSDRIGKEFGETIGVVKAAEMLGLVDTPKDDVHMTEVGWYFLAAPLPVRKALFKHAILKLRLFQMLSAELDAAPDERLDADAVVAELATLLPYDQPTKLFDTLVTWGRYAEILDYDEATRTITRQHPAAEDEDDDT